MALFDDILNSFGGTSSAQAPDPFGVIPPHIPPETEPPPPVPVPPPVDFGPLENIGLLPIFSDETPTFVEANEQLPDLTHNFGNTALAQHFAGLLGPGRGDDLFRLARFLMPFNSQFSRSLLSSNPFVTVDTGLTDQELRAGRRDVRDELAQQARQDARKDRRDSRR